MHADTRSTSHHRDVFTRAKNKNITLIHQWLAPPPTVFPRRLDRRTWKMFFTGLGSGVLWACYHDFAYDYVEPRTDSALTRTALYIGMEKASLVPPILVI